MPEEFIMDDYLAMIVPFPEMWFETEGGAFENRREAMVAAADVAEKYSEWYFDSMGAVLLPLLNLVGDTAVLAQPGSILCAIEQGHQKLFDGLSPAHRAELDADWQLVQWYLVYSWIQAVFTVTGFGKNGEDIVKFTDPAWSAVPFANAALLMLERGDPSIMAGMAADVLGTLMVKPG